MKRIKNNLSEIITAAGVLLLLLYSSDPIMKGDAFRYLYGNLIDPPMYSLIISIMQSLFATLNSVIVFQTFLIGLGIIYFTRSMSKIFDINYIIKIIVSFFLFIPILQFYKNLLTEPISYAFSLLLVGSVINLIYNFNSRNLFWIIGFVIALLLSRNQFIILYPVIFLLFLSIFILNKSKKTLIMLVLSFLSILIIHNSLLTLNKYMKQNTLETKTSLNKKYGPFYFSYIDSIYISTVNDATLFENQNIQNTLTKIFSKMDNQKALVEYYDGRGHYGLSFNNIRNYADDLIENLAYQENTTVADIQKKISAKLIKVNFKKYIKHIFKKFYDSTWLFIFVPFAMLIAALTNFIKYKSQLMLVIIFLSTFALANHSMAYIFGRVQPRYFIYTDFILLVFIFLFFANFLKKSK
jgi:hypothetical protein